MADIEKLDAALKYIEEHPEEWDQGTYGSRGPQCGTVGCLAYHVARLDGAEVEFDEPYEDGWQPVVKLGGKFPANYAAESLGITMPQAWELFSAMNSLEGLRAMRDALAANPTIDAAALDAIASQHYDFGGFADYFD